MKTSMAFLLLVILLVAGRACCNDTTGSVTQPDCEIPTCLINYLQTQTASLQSLKSDVESTKKQLLQATSGKWPPGHYCILANGGCPAGFTRSQGHLRALSQFGASASYITPAKFGDSRIQCHGRCGQYGQWIGDLYMAACCK